MCGVCKNVTACFSLRFAIVFVVKKKKNRIILRTRDCTSLSSFRKSFRFPIENVWSNFKRPIVTRVFNVNYVVFRLMVLGL